MKVAAGVFLVLSSQLMMALKHSCRSRDGKRGCGGGCFGLGRWLTAAMRRQHSVIVVASWWLRSAIVGRKMVEEVTRVVFD